MERYEDFYGARGYIERKNNKYRLTVYCNSLRGVIKTHDKTYNTYKGAKIALGRIGDGWRKVSIEETKA